MKDLSEKGSKLQRVYRRLRCKIQAIAAFQRFPQYFHYFAGELGQLIQKQDAVVCQGNLTGFGVAATAGQGGPGGGVVGGSDGPLKQRP